MPDSIYKRTSKLEILKDTDPLLHSWINDYILEDFDVVYDSKDCIRHPKNLMVKQRELSDGRKFVCHWRSPYKTISARYLIYCQPLKSIKN